MLRRSMLPLRRLLELLFPNSCAACGTAVPADDGRLCEACSSKLLSLAGQDFCRRCGQDAGPYALRPNAAGLPVCGLCDGQPLRYGGIVRVGAYADPLAGMIKRFKYAGGQFMSAVLAPWQAGRLVAQPWFAGVDVLVPVPLHWRRRFVRRFNQSELLAERVGRLTDRPVQRLLSRPVNRPPQASLPRSRRFENVRGVFRADRSAAERTICLIDDVCTTGATLSEASRTLLAAGAEAVYACVVSVAQPPPAYSHMLAAE